jgi:hypothetical protein
MDIGVCRDRGSGGVVRPRCDLPHPLHSILLLALCTPALSGWGELDHFRECDQPTGHGVRRKNTIRRGSHRHRHVRATCAPEKKYVCAGKTRSGDEATAIGVSGHRGSGCVVRPRCDFPPPFHSIPAPRAFSASAVTARREPCPAPASHRPSARRFPTRFQPFDRWLISSLARRFRALLAVVVIVKSETIIGKHRTGWLLLWRWRSRSRRLPGRPPIDADLRTLIRRMWHTAESHLPAIPAAGGPLNAPFRCPNSSLSTRPAAMTPHQDQGRGSGRGLLEGREQDIDLSFASVEPLRNQESLRPVVPAYRECLVDRPLSRFADEARDQAVHAPGLFGRGVDQPGPEQPARVRLPPFRAKDWAILPVIVVG